MVTARLGIRAGAASGFVDPESRLTVSLGPGPEAPGSHVIRDQPPRSDRATPVVGRRYRGRPVVHVELRVDVQEVGLDGRLADEQARRGPPVRLALGDQRQDLELPVAQRVRGGLPELTRRGAPRPTAPAPTRRGTRRRTARMKLLARRVLEQVAGRPGLDRRQRRRCRCRRWSAPAPAPAMPALGQLRRSRSTPSIPGIRRSISTTSGRSDSAIATRLGPVGRLADAPRTPGRRRRSRAARRGPPGGRRRSAAGSRSRAARRRTPIAGTRAEIAVPPPGSDSTASVPATRLTRWRIAVSPKPPWPAAGARARATSKPTPSSRTSRATTSPMYDRVSADPGRAGVLGHVGQRLLRRPQQASPRSPGSSGTRRRRS